MLLQEFTIQKHLLLSRHHVCAALGIKSSK